MKTVRASLVALIGFLASSCGEREPVKDSKAEAFPPSHKIFSYHLDGVGRGYVTPEIPTESELLEQIGAELDLRTSDKSIPELRVEVDEKSSLKLKMRFLHLDTRGGVAFELYELLTLKKVDGDQFRLEYFEGPFSSPKVVGSYPSIAEAVEAIKAEVRTNFFGSYKAMFDTNH